MSRLLSAKPIGASVNIAVLACSKGAEVYSIMWAIRSARPDLEIHLQAVDISEEILKFAERGVYSWSSVDDRGSAGPSGSGKDVSWNTSRDQNAPMFERLSDEELRSMCDVQGDQLIIKDFLKRGIVWRCSDAGDPELRRVLGAQDIVVANRFLCHMNPPESEKCLKNIATVVQPGGHLFVSGIDLDVRTKVACEMGWRPVSELMRDIHEGDDSLAQGWPLEYWGLEPFSESQTDWKIRYASVFQIGQGSCNGKS